MRKITLTFLVAAATWASPVAAQGDWYFGGSAGMTDPTGRGLDKDLGIKIYGGYRFSDDLGAQVGYVDLGEFGAPGGGGVAVDGLEAAVVGRVALNRQVAVIGKGGLFLWDRSGGGRIRGDNGTDATYGFGVEYSLSNDVGVRGQWERFRHAATTDINYFSVGVSFGF